MQTERQTLSYLIDFIHAEPVDKSAIFTQLKCSDAEARLLRLMTREYLEGSADMSAYDLLIAAYDKKQLDFVHHIQEVKNLIDLGWVILNSFHHIKTSELSLLDLLHHSISLSSTFLKLLEEGNLDLVLPEIKAYEDHLEYLQDEFLRIDLYRKLAIIRQSYDQTSPSYKRVRSKLGMLENQIKERIKVSKETPKLHKYFRDRHLEEKEQLIFLALLKEEYAGTDDNLRDMNTLIELISFDDYEKIKNRSLLEENAPLIEKGVIDYDEMLTPFGGISRSFFITEEVLKEVIHPKKKKPQKIRLEALIKEQEIFELLEPRTTLEDVVLHPKTREMLEGVLRQMDKSVNARLKEWGIKDKKSTIDGRIIFHGHPGTGKTLTALSIARSLKKQVISFDCSKILSMYIGESEKNVRKIFDSYKEIVAKTKNEPILLLNEADQFLSARTSGPGSSAEKMHNQMQNIFLEQIERFGGILIATTNLLESIDPAFSRRFDYKIKFEKPDQAQREAIWQKLLPTNAPMAEDVQIAELARHPLTGGQIQLVIKNTATLVAAQEEPLFTRQLFEDVIRKEISGAFGDEKSMGFLA